MTLAISTSSPVVSVAVINEDMLVLGRAERHSPQSASSSVAELTQECLAHAGLTLADIDHLAVDIGPGGFTSTRVGVAFAKSLAWALDVPVSTAPSFDLIGDQSTVVIPSKRGEWIVRAPGADLVIVRGDRPKGVGYGVDADSEVFPQAAVFARLLPGASQVDAMALQPLYAAEPSISIPKRAGVLPGGA